MLFLTSLINLLSGSWMDHPFLTIMLILDGGIYNLVSYCFNLFLLITQLDFSSLFGIVSPIVDRLQAVIMVLVVFKLATSFISWLINPENAPKEGSKLLINIFITAAFLIGYNFVFDVFNEVGMLFTGVPEGRDFVVLKQIADITTSGNRDEGLLVRFIYGSSKDLDEKLTDLGDFVALKTITIFVHDVKNPQNAPTVVNTICDGEECKFSNLSDLSSEIDKKIEYIWGISGIVGIYLVYSIVKVSIAIGVRMFKLLILQILAPIAIVTIIDGGIKSSVFQTYIKKYFSTYIEAFIRILTMFIVIVFISKFYINIGSFFGDFASSTENASFMQQFWVTIIIVVSAFQAVNIIPKFIDEVLGTHMAGDGKGGFGKFVGGLVGSAVGFAGGITAASAAGLGFAGGALNAVSGAVKGYGAGSKGNNVADFFKNTSENKKASRENALNLARMGGVGEYMKHGAESALGIPQRQAAQSQRWADTGKALANMMAARNETASLLDLKNDYDVNYGDEEQYATQMLEYDNDYLQEQNNFEANWGENAYSEKIAQATATARQEVANEIPDYNSFINDYNTSSKDLEAASQLLSEARTPDEQRIAQADFEAAQQKMDQLKPQKAEYDAKINERIAAKRQELSDQRTKAQQDLVEKREERRSAYKKEHHEYIMTNEKINSDQRVINATKDYDSRVDSKHKSSTFKGEGGRSRYKAAKSEFKQTQYQYDNKPARHRDQKSSHLQ